MCTCDVIKNYKISYFLLSLHYDSMHLQELYTFDSVD